jgi:hypothetical protein
MLHELLHGLGYDDGSREEEIGQCEEMVNQARSELGLPLRDQYFKPGDQGHRHPRFCADPIPQPAAGDYPFQAGMALPILPAEDRVAAYRWCEVSR